MRCKVCGKKTIEGMFCPRCYAYLSGSDTVENAKATLSSVDLVFERRSTFKSFYSLQKLKLSLSIAFIILMGLLYSIVIYHVRARSFYIGSMEETLIIATPAPFILSGIIGMISIIKTLIFCVRIKAFDFVIFHKETAANVLFAIKNGILFRCILSEAYEIKKTKCGNILYLNGSTPCALNVGELESTLEAESKL